MHDGKVSGASNFWNAAIILQLLLCNA